ncbi:hypothetical protein L9F63_023001, partial [Diploptera punctata]
NPLTIGTQSSLQLNVSLKNNGEPAYLAFVYLTIPEVCNVLRVPQLCEFDTPNRDLKCLLGNPLIGNSKDILFDIDIKGVPSGTTFLEFELKALSSGEEQNPENNDRILKLSLNTKVNITLKGGPNQKDIVYWRRNNTVDAETPFQHKFEFKNFGPSPLRSIALEFKIPTSVKNAKNIISLEDIEYNSKEMNCERSDRSRRGLRISINRTEVETTTSTSEGSTETETEMEDIEVVTNSSELEVMEPRFKMIDVDENFAAIKESIAFEDKILVMDCKEKSRTCITVNCKINGTIGKQFRAVVNLILNAKFKDLESNLGHQDIIHFFTTGMVTILSPENAEEIQENRPEEVLTTFYGKVKTEGLQLSYVVGIAIGVGVLLLIIIIVIIWK